MVESTLTYLEGWSPASVSIDIKALASEQASINRECPRAEHRDANGQDGQEEVYPGVLFLRRVV
jgi:hypothetical protein